MILPDADDFNFFIRRPVIYASKKKKMVRPTGRAAGSTVSSFSSLCASIDFSFVRFSIVCYELSFAFSPSTVDDSNGLSLFPSPSSLRLGQLSASVLCSLRACGF